MWLRIQRQLLLSCFKSWHHLLLFPFGGIPFFFLSSVRFISSGNCYRDQLRLELKRKEIVLLLHHNFLVSDENDVRMFHMFGFKRFSLDSFGHVHFSQFLLQKNGRKSANQNKPNLCMCLCMCIYLTSKRHTSTESGWWWIFRTPNQTNHICLLNLKWIFYLSNHNLRQLSMPVRFFFCLRWCHVDKLYVSSTFLSEHLKTLKHWQTIAMLCSSSHFIPPHLRPPPPKLD